MQVRKYATTRALHHIDLESLRRITKQHYRRRQANVAAGQWLVIFVVFFNALFFMVSFCHLFLSSLCVVALQRLFVDIKLPLLRF